ncbi:hypothetical protein FRC01_006699 [Tulasnella sp. 417]|nr:hypothetical protein FRC01_006699 [Tulasnella sp. 417]
MGSSSSRPPQSSRGGSYSGPPPWASMEGSPTPWTSRRGSYSPPLPRAFLRGLYARPPPPPVLNLARIPALRVHYDSGTLEKAERPKWENVDEEVLEKVSVLKYDITRLRVDAIVNATKSSLSVGGGVNEIIHDAAGSGLLNECRELNGCEVGKAKITGGYRLPATHVIHTVGPIYDEYRTEKEAAELLRSCYTQSLKLAVEKELKTVAFCSISTGLNGYPIDAATKEAMAATRAFLDSEDGQKIDRVMFCTFSGSDTEVYKQTAPLYFPTSKEYPAQRDTLPDIPFGVEFPPPSTPAEPAEDTDDSLTEDEVLVPRTPGRKASTRLKNRRMDEDDEDESQVPSPAPETDTQQAASPAPEADTQQGADPAAITHSQESQGPETTEGSSMETRAPEPGGADPIAKEATERLA